ncbi:MAG: fibronectin type III domain-containing protein, partial [Bacteroidetes bacterium]|nr:fibronectin type III domain-containing protein [Bacteroidota bacterium]
MTNKNKSSKGYYLKYLMSCLMAIMLWTTSANAQTVTIGTGTSTARYPYAYYFGYARTAMIYTATEMGTTVTGFQINSIGFNCNTASNTGPTIVYMRLVGATTTESATNWATKIAGAANVYSGTPGNTTGFRVVTLSTPFNVLPGQNLEVMVECNYGGSGITPSAGNAIRYSTASNTKQYWEVDNSPPTGNGTVDDNRPNIQINYSALVLSCYPPTAPVGTPTSATMANISWTAASPAPSNGYEYAVTTSSTPPASGTAFAGTGTSVSGLTGNTTYYLHVRSNCGGNGYSTWATSTAFTTPCSTVALPWTENFDAVSIPAFPGCWTKENGDWVTTNNSNSTYDADARSGTQFLRDAYSATNEYMWTPGFSMTVGTTYQFKFWWAGDTYSGWTGDVFVNSTANSTGATQLGSSFVTSGTTTTKTYKQETYNFTPASSGDYYFAIRVNATSNPWYLSFDDFGVDVAPSCFPPTALSGSATSATTANISWTAPSPAPSSGYEYAVTTSSTPPASGTAFAGTGTSVSGLTANTTYYLHVRSNCGGNGYSTWATSTAFTTPCVDNSTFPYLQDFNAATFAPACWQNIQVSGTGLWQRSTAGLYPTVSPIGAGMAYFNSFSYSSGVQANLVSQSNNFPTDLYRVRFKMYRDNGSSSNTDRVLVYYNTAPNLTGATLLGTINRNNTLAPVEAVANQWYEYSFNMPSGSAGSGRYVIFSAISAYGNNIYIDEVNIEAIPSCLPPTALSGSATSTTTANISWTAPSPAPANGYEYAVTTSATPPASGTAFAGTGTSVSGLTGNTTYYLHVRSNCGGNGYSTWATSTAFTTPCNAVNTPYTQDFESVTTPAIPTCTQVIQAGSGNLWATASNPGNGFTTKCLRYAYNGSYAANTWFFTQGLNLTGGTTYILSYNYGNNSTSYTEQLKVAYGASATVGGMTNVLADHTTINQAAIQS